MSRRIPALLLLLAALPLVTAARTGAEAPPVYAIRGARIVPVASAPIESGTVLIRDGLIEAVGPESVVPADAQVIDGKGLTVYPGLIDASSDIGLPAAATPAPASPTGGGGGRRAAAAAPAAAETVENMSSYVRVADVLSDGGARAEAARQAGITTVLTVPGRGIWAGQSALVNLNGDRATMVVRSPVAMHLRLSSTGGFREYPSALMGLFAYVKQSVLDARRYREVWETYRQNLRSLRRPETDRGLEALVPVVEKQLPLVVPGNSPPEVMRALRLAEAADLRIFLSGGSQAGKVAGELKSRDIPVLVSLRFPEKPRDTDPESEESLKTLETRVDAPRNAAALQKAGVRFAFISDGLTPQEFVRNAGRAVKSGLPTDAALRALTLSAAQILGADEQLGSIEKGKIANLVVTDGDLFNEKTKVRYVFVDGRKWDGAAETPRARPAAPLINLAGRWTVTVDAPGGQGLLTFDLAQTGADLTGSVASAMNRSEITDGVVSGREFRFRANVRIGEQDVALSFSGTAEGDMLKGKASIGMREYDFTGKRAPAGGNGHE